MARTKTSSAVAIDATFYQELMRFYRANKPQIRKNYRHLTRVLLDYNDPSLHRPGQFLRDPQFEALEIYVFLKEYLKLPAVHQLFEDWYKKQNGFENRKEAQGQEDQYSLDNQGVFNDTAYATVFKKMKAAQQNYPNYIFALTMGVGKTLLMATFIFYEFVLARKFPDDPLYCHNALIFAPDKTVLQSLREIETFDFEKVLPPEHAHWLQANLKMQYLEETGTTLNLLNNSDYNLIISNNQKIILKKKHTSSSPITQMFLNDSVQTQNSHSEYDNLNDLYGLPVEDDAELITNQRYLKLRNLTQLGIFVDEAHHAFGDSLTKGMLDAKKDTSLRYTINALAQDIKKLGSRVVICCNFTGTPYVKNEVLPEVVYSYSLKSAIENFYLKTLMLHKYENTRDKEFVRAVVKNFVEKFKDRRLEGMLPKLAFFSPTVEDANGNLRLILEDVLTEYGIPTSSILINVGDEKITSNDDIRAFNALDTPSSKKQFLILVNKGKEGWNCRSLCGVAMFRKPKSKVFVLQASMRCLRAIGDKQEEGQVYLTNENAEILNEEMQQNFRISTEELQNINSNSIRYEVHVLKKKSIKLTQVRHIYICNEKQLTEPISFEMDKWDIEKYKIFHIQEKTKLQPGRQEHNEITEDISDIKERRTWTAYTLVAEIARYLCTSPLKIEKILRESKEGLDALVAKINEFNELLYDRVIPLLFQEMYIIDSYERKEDKIIDLIKDPVKGFYPVHGKENKTQLYSNWQQKHADLAAKSFHLDTYCFDSIPEQNFFLNAINKQEIKEIYFTGMLTHNQTDFRINYIDPDTHGIRNYYPDFLIQTRDGAWIVVEVKAHNMMEDSVVQAKRDFAESVLKASRISYCMVPHDYAATWDIRHPDYEPSKQQKKL